MTILVFGATGVTGKQLVQQALLNGHTVKAFGRNVFTEFETGTKNLELIKGALFDEGEVLNAVKGSDMVVSALGGATDGTDKTRTLGIKNIIAQMQKAGAKRMVALAGIAALNADDNTLIVDSEDYPRQLIPVGKEYQEMYEHLKSSTLDWTLVCAPEIITHDATGSFITSADYPPQPNNNKIYSGDLALFMLDEGQKNSYLKQRVGISN